MGANWSEAIGVSDVLELDGPALGGEELVGTLLDEHVVLSVGGGN